MIVNDMQSTRDQLLESQRESAAKVLHLLDRSRSMIEELSIAERRHREEVTTQLDRLDPKPGTFAPAEPVFVRSNRLDHEALPVPARMEGMHKLDRILFIGYCWGSAGTRWLAKLLNAHPDIFCLHAPIFPRFNHVALKDSLEIVGALFHGKGLGHPYSHVGLTHGVSLEWHSHFVHHFEQVRGFITIRHPIPRIHSTYSHNMVPGVAKAKQADAEFISNLMKYHERLETLSGKIFPKDYEALSFYHGCGMVNAIVSEVASGLPLFKYEDLTTDYRMVQHLLRIISDDHLDMGQSLIERIQQTPVGTRAGRVQDKSPRLIHESWNEVQREAFHWLVTKESIGLYRKAGYELDP